jgi:hypothetical protein
MHQLPGVIRGRCQIGDSTARLRLRDDAKRQCKVVDPSETKPTRDSRDVGGGEHDAQRWAVRTAAECRFTQSRPLGYPKGTLPRTKSSYVICNSLGGR